MRALLAQSCGVFVAGLGQVGFVESMLAFSRRLRPKQKMLGLRKNYPSDFVCAILAPLDFFLQIGT